MSGKYIVVFKKHVSSAQVDNYAQDINSNGGEVGKHFSPVLNGFAATIPDSYLTQLQSLQGDVVDYIEEDSVVHTQ